MHLIFSFNSLFIINCNCLFLVVKDIVIQVYCIILKCHVDKNIIIFDFVLPPFDNFSRGAKKKLYAGDTLKTTGHPKDI